jgi:adenylate cyclase
MSRPLWYSSLDAWFLESALGGRSSETLIDELMGLLRANGLPVRRFALSFGTLDPLFQSATLLWRPEQGTQRERFRRDSREQPEWLRSPMKRVLDGPERWLDWALPAAPEEARRHPLLADLAEAGCALYAVEALSFDKPGLAFLPPYDGMLVSWAGAAADPFRQDEFLWLQRLNRRIAGLAKAMARENRALALARTYLGPLVGQRIFRGLIARGDVEELEGVLWYCDLRGSTRLADELAPRDFMRLLNDFFDCTAAEVEKAGGAVLKFIGDAVLAGFPQPLPEAIAAALSAARAAEAAAVKANERRRAAGEPEIVYGLALRCGSVLFGNVGTPQRLDFTVIGSAVNEVARMEALTKELGVRLIVDETIAAAEPDAWRALGEVALRGLERPLALFARS